MEEVILVNEYGEEKGRMEKYQAHRQGALHRAFSIIVVDEQERLLIHRRADGKYHSAGQWSNTCCSHPRPGEGMRAALSRKLQQEMGFDCPMNKLFDFVYRADMENGMVEHEYDHVYLGRYSGKITPNPSEVSEHRFIPLNELIAEMELEPGRFTPWFRLIVPRMTRFLRAPERA